MEGNSSCLSSVIKIKDWLCVYKHTQTHTHLTDQQQQQQRMTNISRDFHIFAVHCNWRLLQVHVLLLRSFEQTNDLHRWIRINSGQTSQKKEDYVHSCVYLEYEHNQICFSWPEKLNSGAQRWSSQCFADKHLKISCFTGLQTCTALTAYLLFSVISMWINKKLQRLVMLEAF